MKPQWQPGASQPIKLRKTGPTAAAPAAKAAPVKLWGSALDLEDDELVDDDELLTEEDMQRPSVPGAPCCCARLASRALECAVRKTSAIIASHGFK